MSTKKTQAKANGTAPKACKSCTDKCAKAKKAEAKTAKAADKPKHKPRTEAQKMARRERDAKRREAMKAAKKPAEKKADASGSKVDIKFELGIGGINRNVADLYGSIMTKVFERVSTEVKHLLNAFDDAISEAKKK